MLHIISAAAVRNLIEDHRLSSDSVGRRNTGEPLKCHWTEPEMRGAQARLCRWLHGLLKGQVHPADSASQVELPSSTSPGIWGSWIFSRRLMLLIPLPVFPEAGLLFSYPRPLFSVKAYKSAINQQHGLSNFEYLVLSGPVPDKAWLQETVIIKEHLQIFTIHPLPPDIKSFSLGWRRPSKNCPPPSL